MNIEVMGTAKERKKEIEKKGAFAVTDGDGMSPTVSFKKDPNLEVLAKT